MRFRLRTLLILLAVLPPLLAGAWRLHIERLQRIEAHRAQFREIVDNLGLKNYSATTELPASSY